MTEWERELADPDNDDVNTTFDDPESYFDDPYADLDDDYDDEEPEAHPLHGRQSRRRRRYRGRDD